MYSIAHSQMLPPAILLVTWRSGGRPGQYGRFRPR